MDGYRLVRRGISLWEAENSQKKALKKRKKHGNIYSRGILNSLFAAAAAGQRPKGGKIA